MSEEKEAEAVEVTDQKTVTKDAAGNYYDDEVGSRIQRFRGNLYILHLTPNLML